MKKWILILITTGMIAQVGCDSKKSSQDAAIEDLVATSDQKQKEMLEQLDSGEGLGMDTEYVGDMADKIDEVAKGLSEDEAKLLNDQADALREIQAIMKPYEDTLNAFIGLGGLDVNSYQSADDFKPRIEMVNQLIEVNEQVALEFPPLLRRLGGDPVVLAKKLGLIAQIRQTDRDLFPSMNRYMEILRDYWDQVQRQPTGDVLFDEGVPDEVINEFNEHAQAIQRISAEQIELQRAVVQLDQP